MWKNKVSLHKNKQAAVHIAYKYYFWLSRSYSSSLRLKNIVISSTPSIRMKRNVVVLEAENESFKTLNMSKYCRTKVINQT